MSNDIVAHRRIISRHLLFEEPPQCAFQCAPQTFADVTDILPSFGGKVHRLVADEEEFPEFPVLLVHKRNDFLACEFLDQILLSFDPARLQ